jgi:DNA-binding transcriptional regulator GbsR (MarR family)
MGGRWGINRTVAQIHALLFLSPRPLHAEEIADTLSVARSNVSTSLKELQSWGLVRVAHVLGDRRDHFEAGKDVWATFRRVMAERKKREIDPTVQVLRDTAAALEHGDAHARDRVRDLLEFFETALVWYDALHDVPPATIRKLGRVGGSVRKLFGLGG